MICGTNMISVNVALSQMKSHWDTHEFRVILGIFIVLGHIGQSDLLRTYYELLQVWNTPGRQHVWNM